ncbi:MAG: hypothetical protein ACREJU_16525 [Nitrospiraceae bacterium]
MTVALCVKCGAFKHGAFNTCDSCGFRPVDDYDFAYSLALSDHYFTLEALREIGAAIPKNGRPSLPPEQEKQMLATIRDPNLQRILGLGATGVTATKKNTVARKGTTVIGRLFGRQSKARIDSRVREVSTEEYVHSFLQHMIPLAMDNTKEWMAVFVETLGRYRVDEDKITEILSRHHLSLFYLAGFIVLHSQPIYSCFEGSTPKRILSELDGQLASHFRDSLAPVPKLVVDFRATIETHSKDATAMPHDAIIFRIMEYLQFDEDDGLSGLFHNPLFVTTLSAGLLSDGIGWIKQTSQEIRVV